MKSTDLSKYNAKRMLSIKGIHADKFARICDSKLNQGKLSKLTSKLDELGPYEKETYAQYGVFAGIASSVIVSSLASYIYLDTAVAQAALILFSGTLGGFLSGKLLNKYLDPESRIDPEDKSEIKDKLISSYIMRKYDK